MKIEKQVRVIRALVVETSDGLGLKGRLSRLNIIIEVSDSAEISRKHKIIRRYPPNY